MDGGRRSAGGALACGGAAGEERNPVNRSSRPAVAHASMSAGRAAVRSEILPNAKTADGHGRDADEAKRFDVVGLGANTLDHVCVPARPVGFDTKQRLRSYFRQPGGQVPTALVALQRWGLRTAYAGPIAADEGGRLQRESLLAEGVDLSGTFERPDAGSQTSFILVDLVTGERSILWERPVGLEVRAEELDPALIASGRLLLMDAEDAEVALRAAEWARQAGALVVLDVDQPGPRIAELIAATDMLIVSRDFARRLVGGNDLRSALRRMREMGAAVAIVTLGLGGAIGENHSALLHAPAPRVRAVDTTSAGDVFHAASIYALLHGWPLDRLLHFAATAAALECTALGGRAAIPTLEQIEAVAPLPS